MGHGDFLFGIIAGITLTMMITLMIFLGDDMDWIDTRALGEIMCEEQNLTYSHRTWMGTAGYIPVIHCIDKEPEESEPLIDGILVKD